MNLSDFDFDLPDGRIATRPVRPRSAARLLVAEGATPRITDAHVRDLTRWLRPGDRLILNDTRVIPARLTGTRRRHGPDGVTEARIETTLLEPLGEGRWKALLKPLKKVRDGERIAFTSGLSARVEGRSEGTATLRLEAEGDLDAAIDAAGQMPLPPYIAAQRPADARDREDYQTIWAQRPGAVAAPTASLHFDKDLMTALNAHGVETTHVTLHVGAGTFLPVKDGNIADHKMHAERGEVTPEAAAAMMATKAAGGRIIPVGTTAMRLIETAATGPRQMAAWHGATDIFITPGFQFRMCDGLMTNFHLPKSTLMMLVSAFMGYDQIRAIYDHAIAEEYRFFSYGDASLLLPGA